ncbi:hypothetical protein JOL79_16715 [Microbispora sp. RL4-1S]|uniref:Uncharacterized protein n=1 Tax=Microbispora oryzae TaxID=2806554 RepID=A0A940WH48_9ACTN|nr:hypothetical protein [Microbispora oryzae]MBP2705455.1 hypothetical protein [Microbispora oryzae]
MPDSLTLGALGAVALSEGIKFLYDEARELLKRWRERRDRDVVEVPGSAAEVLDAPLAAAEVADSVVAENSESLTSLRRELIEYAEEGRVPDPGDRGLLETVDALRRVLEVAYGQRITFRGEQREPTGTGIDVTVEADVVEGYLAGLRARGGLGPGTEVHSRMRVGRVSAGGEAVGVDLDGRSG